MEPHLKNYRHRAFGVQPARAPYRLRQARYHGMADDVSRFLQEHPEQTIRLLDVGVHSGVSRRFLEVRPGAERIEFHGVDVFPKGREFVYKHHDWRLHFADLEFGLPNLPTGSFDVVLCEQVLEHLYNVDFALEELARVLRPGGLLLVGVPIFPPGLAPLRRTLIPWFDRRLGRAPRSHVQAWSLSEFRTQVERVTGLPVAAARGYRFVSGGPLRPLEHLRGWWLLNRALGARLPGLCTEVQLLLRKPRCIAGALPAGGEPLASRVSLRNEKAAQVAA